MLEKPCDVVIERFRMDEGDKTVPVAIFGPFVLHAVRASRRRVPGRGGVFAPRKEAHVAGVGFVDAQATPVGHVEPEALVRGTPMDRKDAPVDVGIRIRRFVLDREVPEYARYASSARDTPEHTAGVAALTCPDVIEVLCHRERNVERALVEILEHGKEWPQIGHFETPAPAAFVRFADVLEDVLVLAVPRLVLEPRFLLVLLAICIFFEGEEWELFAKLRILRHEAHAIFNGAEFAREDARVGFEVDTALFLQAPMGGNPCQIGWQRTLGASQGGACHLVLPLCECPVLAAE